MQNELCILFCVFGMGAMLGLFFYGGLYWTVSRGVEISRTRGNQPGFLFVLSPLLRTMCAIYGLNFIGSGDFKRLSLCLWGFVCARLMVTYWTKPKKTSGVVNGGMHRAT